VQKAVAGRGDAAPERFKSCSVKELACDALDLTSEELVIAIGPLAYCTVCAFTRSRADPVHHPRSECNTIPPPFLLKENE
jgi:hypothetical protein